MTNERFKNFIDKQLEQNPIERKMLTKIRKALADAGTPITRVFNGSTHTKVRTLRELQEVVFNLDVSWLKTADGSWVLFIIGNEWDALSDYTLDLEDALASVDEWIDKNN